MTQEWLPFALPDITETEIEGVVSAMRSGWVTTGPRTKEFERAFAEAVGAPHAIALNSCTAALHLALEALGIGPDDEVIVPTLTFAATAEVVRYLGARPVLVDVLASDHQIDPTAVERAITDKTRAIIPVHFAGQACALDEVLTVAKQRRIPVIEDAAHAFPVAYRGRPVGSIGDITCFSFYATKTITTGEGGMATTANDEWADRMRIMSLHGISRDAWKRYSAEGTWRYDITAPGYKYNMTDIAAALGLSQLARAADMSARRTEIARRYSEAFDAVDALERLATHDDRDHAWHLFVLKPRTEALTIDRDRFIVELKERGIGTSVHFIPLHMHSYYRQTYGYRENDFPVASACFERSLSLPIYSKMSDEHVTRVIEAVLDVVRRHRR